MSRGYGKTQRAILVHFKAHPEEAFTTAELVAAVYGEEVEANKSRRVSVIRAGRALEEDGHLSRRRLMDVPGDELIWFVTGSEQGLARTEERGCWRDAFTEQREREEYGAEYGFYRFAQTASRFGLQAAAARRTPTPPTSTPGAI